MSEINILYHYCSTASFESIVRTKTIWLSSLSLSNDSMEGKLVRAAVIRLAERDGLDRSARDQLQRGLEFSERYFDGLGFCLSSEGDLLSQWRGYADDAKGVSIGFRSSSFEAISASSIAKGGAGFQLSKVEYDEAQHVAKVESTYRELRRLIDAGAFRHRGLLPLLDTRTPDEVARDDNVVQKANNALILKMMELIPVLYQLKSSAFREESEWRLVSMRAGDDMTGCGVRVARNKVVPYRQFELLLQESPPPIAEVILGPRHETPESVLKAMLREAGFGDVNVRRAEATYRPL